GTRVARRHVPGPADLAARLEGTTVVDARRRGKYLWLVVDHEPQHPLTAANSAAPDEPEGDEALVIHLGMSGQMLVEDADAPWEKHCHAVFDLSPDETGTPRQLRFVDQRTFGGLQLVDLVADHHGAGLVPIVVAHIAPDPLEPVFDQTAVVRAARRRH